MAKLTDLPTELLIAIADYISSHRHTQQLRLVNRRFADIGLPFLFRQFGPFHNPAYGNAATSVQARRFLRVLRDNPQLAGCTESVVVTLGFGEESIQHTRHTQAEHAADHSIWQAEARELRLPSGDLCNFPSEEMNLLDLDKRYKHVSMVLLLCKLYRLKTLTLRIKSTAQWHVSLGASILPVELKSLTRLSLTGGCDVGFLTSIMLAAENLKHLEGDHCYGGLWPTQQARGKRLPIATIEFTRSFISNEYFDGLFQLTNNLVKLRYRWIYDDHDSTDDFSPLRFGQALQLVRATLEELELGQDGLYDEGVDIELTTVLAEFPRLKRIKTDFVMLDTTLPTNHTLGVADLLPQALEALTIIVYKGDQMLALYTGVTELVGEKRHGRMRSFRELRIVLIGEPAAGIYGFVNPEDVRLRAELAEEKCAEYGVRYEVKLIKTEVLEEFS